MAIIFCIRKNCLENWVPCKMVTCHKISQKPTIKNCVPSTSIKIISRCAAHLVNGADIWALEGSSIIGTALPSTSSSFVFLHEISCYHIIHATAMEANFSHGNYWSTWLVVIILNLSSSEARYVSSTRSTRLHVGQTNIYIYEKSWAKATGLI